MDLIRSCLKTFAMLAVVSRADLGMSSQCKAAAYEFCCSLGRKCHCNDEWKPLAFFLSGECNLLKRSFCCNLGCQCSQSISDGDADQDETTTSQSYPAAREPNTTTGEVGRGSDGGNMFVSKTGESVLCPLDVPCGNVLIPTAAPGSFCTTECSEFNGAFWCCAQSDGCPQGGKGNEQWGWCENQELAREPLQSSKAESTQRTSAGIHGSVSEGHRHAQAQEARHHHKISLNKHAGWEDVQRRDIQLESAALTFAILAVLGASTHLVYFVCSRSFLAPAPVFQSSAVEPLLGTPVVDVEPSVSTSDYSDSEHLKVRCVRVQVHGLQSVSTRPITCSVEVDDVGDGRGTCTNVHLKFTDDVGFQIGGGHALQHSASDAGYLWTKTLTFTDGTWQLLEPRTRMELDHGVAQMCFVRRETPPAIQTPHTLAVASSFENFATSSNCSDDWVEIHGTATEEI